MRDNLRRASDRKEVPRVPDETEQVIAAVLRGLTDEKVSAVYGPGGEHDVPATKQVLFRC